MGSIDIITPSTVATQTFNTEHYTGTYVIPQVGEVKQLPVVANQSDRSGIVDLIGAAGPAAYGTDVNGTGWFVDRVRPGLTSTIVSVAVEIVPQNLPEMDGFFGICVGGEDETTTPGSNRPLTVEVVVLAHELEYNDVLDFQSSHEVSVP